MCIAPTHLREKERERSEKVFAALEVTNRHFNHYKNRIILKWQNIGPLEVI